MKRLPSFLRGALGAAVAFATLQLSAATYTWTGAGFFGNQDFLWSNPYNWSELEAPQPGEQGVSLVFPNNAAPRQTTNDVINLVIKSVLFQGANYSIHGAGANGVTMTLRGDNGGTFVVVGAASGCQFGDSTRLHFGSDGAMAIVTGGSLTVKSRLSGIYGFTKSSPGTLTLEGSVANTFTGGADVVDGVLELRRSAVAIPGPLVIGSTDFSRTPIVRLRAHDQIGDTSPVTVNANGRLDLNGYNDLLGTLTMASGAVTMHSGFISGRLTLNGNVTNRLGVADDSASISGILSLGSTTRGFVVEADTELVVSAKITATTAGLVKSGLGQLRLTSANNDYFGSTIVQAGTLHLAGGAPPGSTDNGTVIAQGAHLVLWDSDIGDEALTLNGLPNTPVLSFIGTNSWAGPVTVAGDCMLDRGASNLSNNKLTLSGNVGGTGAMRLSDWADLHFTGLGNNTFSGGYYGDSGRTYFEKALSASAIGGPLYVGRADESFPGALVNVRTINQIPSSSLVTLRNSGALSIYDNATDTLGHVVFEGGWLVSDNGVFTLSGNITNRLSPDNISAIYGTVALAAGEHVIHGEELSILNVHGVLAGSGGVTVRGELSMVSFYNTNTYAGLTHVAEGTLRLHDAGRPGSTAAGTRVDGLASLQLRNAAVTNETLTLEYRSIYAPIVFCLWENIWKGPIVLNARGDFRTINFGTLTIDGVISGPEGLWFESDSYQPDGGTLVLRGAQSNTYLKGTWLKRGRLVLDKTFGVAIPGSLHIGRSSGDIIADVICAAPNQFAINVNSTPACDVLIDPPGKLKLSGYNQTVRHLQFAGGDVDTEGGVLTLGGDIDVTAKGFDYQTLKGKLKLVTGAQFGQPGTHQINLSSNAFFSLQANISQGADAQSLVRSGSGLLLMTGTNSFSGTFTVGGGYTTTSGEDVFGTPAAGTTVLDGATLQIENGRYVEPFSLAGSGSSGTNGALVAIGTNVLAGLVTLMSEATVDTLDSSFRKSRLLLTGQVNGPGGLVKQGEGVLVFAGSFNNSFNGTTRVQAGQMELAQTNSYAIRGALDIRANGLVRYLRDAQLSDLTPVTIASGGQFRLLGFSDTIGSLSGMGIVELLDGTLITGNDNTATTYGGVISGIGGTLTKTGSGVFTLAGDNAYTGTTFVKGGTLLVRGQQPQSDVTIQTGGTLGGNGAVGIISDLSGHVKPGTTGYGILKSAGFLTHSPANLLQIEINGTTPGQSFDQLDVNGGVTLMGGTLQLAMHFSGAVSNQYVIIRNDGTDPVSGSFNGLPQGGLIVANGAVFRINYQGGDGNDVVLTQTSLAGIGPELNGITKLTDGTVQLGGTGLPNGTYAVEATASLSAPINWVEIGVTTANAQGQFTFVDPDAASFAARFYRFRLEE